MWLTHVPTFNKWHKNNNNKKKLTHHMLTHGARVCWLLWWFASMTKFCDIRERNVTIRSEIWIINIRSLGFRNIRECATLWRLIVRSLGCTMRSTINTIGMTYVFNYEINKHALPLALTITKSREVRFSILYIYRKRKERRERDREREIFIIDLLMQQSFCCVNVICRSRRTWTNKPNNTHTPECE
jgi:hypothetical protein